MRADPRLYVAMDVPNVGKARWIVETLGDAVVSYKIGLQLLPVGGTELAGELIRHGKNVFLDYKLYDIGTTVTKATAGIVPLGVKYLTVHATPEIMRAAIKGRGKSDLKILGVTVLTSLDDESLAEMGYFMRAEELALHRARQAVNAGIDGVIASPLEAAAIRKTVPKDFQIITPGMRMPEDAVDDQKRIATPARALSNGASAIVIGRPVTQSKDPKAAAMRIAKNMQQEI